MIPVGPYASLPKSGLPLFPPPLPAVKNSPRKAQTRAPTEMPVPAFKTTCPQAPVHEQVQAGLVLQIERTQGKFFIQTVQTVLFHEKARHALFRHAELKPDGGKFHIERVADAAKQVQIRQMGMVRLQEGKPLFPVRLLFHGQQAQIRLFHKAVPDQKVQQLALAFEQEADRIGKSHAGKVKKAKQVLLRHGTFQITFFQMDTIPETFHAHRRLFPRYLVGGKSQQGLPPSQACMKMPAAFPQVVSVIIHGILGVPGKRSPSPIPGNDRHEKIFPRHLQTGTLVKGFQTLQFRLLDFFLVMVIAEQGTVPLGGFDIILQKPSRQRFPRFLPMEGR